MFGWSGAMFFALSCAGSSPGAEVPAPAASAGDEPPPTAAAATHEVGPTVEAGKSARGRIVVQARCAGKLVPARGRMPIERELVVDFEMGQEISAEAGTRRIEVALTDSTILIDKPTLQLDVVVEPQKLAKVEAVFPWAKVQLNLLVNGKAQPPTAVKLIRGGNVVAEVKSGGPAFLASPGNYEAEVSLRGKPVRVKGLVFFESTEQVVPVRAQR
jgi:hypothetical protein